MLQDHFKEKLSGLLGMGNQREEDELAGHVECMGEKGFVGEM
jgi:hypothetical protein